MDGITVFEGRVAVPISVNLADIIDASISYFREVPDNNTDALYEIEDPGDLSCRGVTVWIENNEGDQSYPVEFTAIPGGISKQNYRRLCDLGTDVFSARFFEPKGNFFLTTRTASWCITMKETELAPMYFILKTTSRITITEAVGNNSIDFGDCETGVYALDINILRKKFFNENNVLPSQFDVFTNQAFSCRIVVERAETARERYRLKFRNSLGVFEIIELVGELILTPSYEDGDGATFQRYDEDTDDFQTERERLPRTLLISAQTGTKRPDEVRFLMDMIASDEVYLLDFANLPVKVIPSIEELQYRRRPERPQSFTVNLELTDREMNIMQDIVDGTESRRPRIFSKQFSEHFN
ncbi:MAG: hypothetical protein K2M06_02665 [Muribaculaceae bacterium]|nr:hypothetical protein [Muribaculaceae bacterium]